MILTCVNCKNTIEATINENMPKEAVSLECNYCPNCEQVINDDYWEEWCVDKNGVQI